MKVCSTCKEKRDTAQFSKDKNRKDGLYPVCKLCKSKKNKQRYLENSSKIRAKSKAWKEANRESYLAKQRAYGNNRSKTVDGKYIEYKTGAKKRGYIFNLTKDSFSKYWQQPCFYCGTTIDTIGLDRKDNEIGYTEDNVVACCKICNRAKDTMSSDDYIKHCNLVMKNWSKNEE